jgi:uncharacterized surface protein with fasciclin (FAS1) repeats
LEEITMTTQTSPATIVDIALSSPDHTTLVTAVQAAGLVEVLSSSGGEFTLFAPTNEAFSRLPEGTLESLLGNKEQLAEILKYHVVAGRYMASDVVGSESLPSLEGHSIPVSIDGGGAHVGSATITATDIVAGNGVVHVIDQVILPESS